MSSSALSAAQRLAAALGLCEDARHHTYLRHRVCSAAIGQWPERAYPAPGPSAGWSIY